MSPKRVCFVGSGNFACAMAVGVATNTAANTDTFLPDVNMWVFQETVDGRNLTDIINADHENVKYLPGVKLPANIVAVPDLADAAAGADVLVFCLPHQFLPRVCATLKGGVKAGAVAISLIKGFHSDASGFRLISEFIEENLGVETSVLMGANLAAEIGRGEFCESTIGSRNPAHGDLFRLLFHTPTFRIHTTSDVSSVDMCGALKNIVAVAVGFLDALSAGNNTKAMVIRFGLMEMLAFIRLLHPETTQPSTLLHSCGVADMITTCFGGRNRLVAEAFARGAEGEGKTLQDLEKEMLNGQKLQGPITAEEVAVKLEKEAVQEKFPLFMTVHKICQGQLKPSDLLEVLKAQSSSYGEVLW